MNLCAVSGDADSDGAAVDAGDEVDAEGVRGIADGGRYEGELDEWILQRLESR